MVKTGIRREAAALCAPAEARERIARDVRAALTGEHRPAPLVWNGRPLRLTFTRAIYCDLAETCPGAVRLDGRTLEIGGETFADLYRGCLTCLRLAESQA